MTLPPAARALELLRQRGQTLATAESLTGGLIGGALTDVAGASASYLGGVITYATRLKAELADVAPTTLDRYGPVDAATALEMAAGVRQRCGSDWGLAVTGVAGPEPQDGHPVGQVFVAVAGPDPGASRCVQLHLSGSRADIRTGTVAGALALLVDLLAGTG